jgi:glycine dehydrogenase subunit 1
VQRAHYAARLIGAIPGVRIVFPGGFFKEFVVDFTGTGRTVRGINAALRERGIFGGGDISAFPELGQAALYCVTEMHEDGDIERLAADLREIVAP